MKEVDMAWWNILAPVIAPVTDYFKDGQKIKAAKAERKDELKSKALDARLEGIRNAQESDIDMDNNARKLSGWMDDVSFFVFLMPMVLAFYPPALPHIEAGFAAIETMPVPYQYAIGMMLVAIWGYRRLVTPIVEIVVKTYAKRLGG